MNANPEEIKVRLRKSFPSMLLNDVNVILDEIDLNSELSLSEDSFLVKINDEKIEIPQRVYFETVNVLTKARLSSTQKEILDCLYTRHHDGYVREKALKSIVGFSNICVIPFIIRLFGEYVIEILQVIYQSIDQLEPSKYGHFIENNKDFYEVNKQRVLSYWDCYYRKIYPLKDDYVGFKLIKFFDSLVLNY